MGRQLGQSLLALAYSQITSSRGSPYLKVRAQIKAGAILYNPMKNTRLAVHMDMVKNYASDMQIHMVIPQGDLMQYITPYQDDLTITLTLVRTSTQGNEEDDEELFTTSYRAYLNDQTRNPIEFGNTAGQADVHMENLANLNVVSFRLEELGVEQLRMMRIGSTPRGNIPADVAVAMLNSYAASIQLEDSDKITGPTIEEGYSTVKRSVIHIKDNTPLLNLPDLLQNNEGGIYKEALGFFVSGNHMYLWPLYKLDRQDQAKRLLRVYVSPDPKAQVPERTWRIPDDTPDVLEIWIGAKISVDDQSQSVIQQYGTGVRNIDPGSILGDGDRVEGNRIYKDASKTSMSFKEMDLVNGRAIVNSHEATTNPFRLTSKLAKAKGLTVHVVWHHSLMNLITPAMAVEFIYDYQGEVRTINGTLLEAITMVDSVGTGLQTVLFRSTTGLALFIDRNDAAFTKWVDEENALDASVVPQQDTVFR